MLRRFVISADEQRVAALPCLVLRVSLVSMPRANSIGEATPTPLEPLVKSALCADVDGGRSRRRVLPLRGPSLLVSVLATLAACHANVLSGPSGSLGGGGATASSMSAGSSGDGVSVAAGRSTGGAGAANANTDSGAHAGSDGGAIAGSAGHGVTLGSSGAGVSGSTGVSGSSGVSGSDGVSGSNGVSGSSGVSGSTGKACGGPSAVTCSPFEWCEFPGGTCGAGAQWGQCQTVTPATNDCSVPVCGCNGMAYCNASVAHGAGTAALSSNFCKPSVASGAGAPCFVDADCKVGFKCCSGGSRSSPLQCVQVAGAACPAVP